jgi:putative NADH-flavin reductase
VLSHPRLQDIRRLIGGVRKRSVTTPVTNGVKIALFGAGGTIGQRIADEAVGRGHEVTGVVRDPSALTGRDGLIARTGDVLDPVSVATAVAGHDAVVSAVGPGQGADPGVIVGAARSLIQGLGRAGIRRLLVVGGAASLEVAPGVQLFDAPDFPEAWKPVAGAHREALDVYRTSAGDLDWTYISPAALIAPGERTGKFRIGGDQLLTGSDGQSRISAEDYAVALVDELEKPQHLQQRITVAY